MKGNNSKAKQNCGAAYMITAVVGLLLAIAGIIMYQYAPGSDIANSIEHSAKDGFFLLALSPVFSITAFVVYLVGGLNDKALVKNSVVQLVIFIVSAVLLLASAVISAGMFISQLSLGFVAPVDGTVWETLGIVSIICVSVFALGNGYIFATARK